MCTFLREEVPGEDQQLSIQVSHKRNYLCLLSCGVSFELCCSWFWEAKRAFLLSYNSEHILSLSCQKKVHESTEDIGSVTLPNCFRTRSILQDWLILNYKKNKVKRKYNTDAIHTIKIQ